MQWLDSGRAEHIGRFEVEAQKGVFSLAFDAGPHGAALFGAVGCPTGDVDDIHVVTDRGL
jgi:hypothetical protein